MRSATARDPRAETDSPSLSWRMAALALVLATLLVPPADAREGDLSAQSQASLAASVEVPAAMAVALSEGGRFVVQAVAISGGVAVVTVSAVGVAGSVAVVLSVEAVKALGIVAGHALEVVAVSGGWVLESSGEALCFIADEHTRRHIRSREISP
jgi:hypothetical protein